MKLAKTNEKEIEHLSGILNELEQFNKYDSCKDIEEINWEDYDILSTFNKDSYECLFKDVAYYISHTRFQKILFNCSTLLENCADPDSDVLDFNSDIKKGLELLKQEKHENKSNL